MSTVAGLDEPIGEEGFGAPLARAALDALPMSLAVVDRTGVIVAVNESWRRFARDNGGGADIGVGTD